MGAIMNEREIIIRIRISRRVFVWASAVLLMCCAANEVVSESLTMTTYYPAPTGTYQRLVTTGGIAANPSNTILARDAGSVGIGTTSPAALLDVNGKVRFDSGNIFSDGSGNLTAASVTGCVYNQ
jgi:hypothetical protein